MLILQCVFSETELEYKNKHFKKRYYRFHYYA